MSGSRRLVLVCRRGEYAAMAAGDVRIPGEAPIVQDTRQIILEDLTLAQISSYLTHRFPDPAHADRVQERWQSILDGLTCDSQPTSLGKALGRPWRLFLAVNAYFESDTDPNQMTNVPPDKLAHELMAQLIPAVTLRRPLHGRRDRYHPDEVRAWLATLARHLRRTSAEHSWSATNLYLDDIWPVAGWRKPRYIAFALVEFVGVVACGVAVAAGALTVPLAVVSLVPFVMLAGWRTLDPEPSAMEELDLRQLKTKRGRRAVASWVAFASASGLIWASVGMFIAGSRFGPTYILTHAAAYGIPYGFAFGLVAGLSNQIHSIDRPSTPARLRYVDARRSL